MTTDTPILDKAKIETPKRSANDDAAEKSAIPVTGNGVCPLNVNKIQLLPVRFALVENLTPEKDILTKAISKSDQEPLLTKLTSHPVGIRFIRDGWLYIYNYTTTNNLPLTEFKTKNGVIIQGTKRGREGQKETQQAALVIDKQQDIQIRVCFSEVQWSDEKCKQVIDDEPQRTKLMYSIRVGDISCESQGPNILTKEKAQNNIADVAEKNQKNATNYLFPEESEPYSWIDKDTHFTTNSPLSKLNSQLVSECKENHYVYIVIPDPIGIMLDLAQEQEKIVEWQETWNKQKSPRGENKFVYTIANYVNGMLHISDANANQYNSSGQDWLSALTQDQRKSIYDYINCANKNERMRRTTRGVKGWSYFFKYLSVSQEGRAEAEQVNTDVKLQEQQMEQQQNSLEQQMIGQLGGVDIYFKNYRAKVEDLKTQQYAAGYGDYVTGKQGVYDVANISDLNSFLDKHSGHLKRWSIQLEKITADRLLLFKQYFHNATWYFDTKDQQSALTNLEVNCIRGLTRSSEAIASLKAFFNLHPYYLLPGYHTMNYTAKVLEMGGKFKEMIKKGTEFEKMLTTGEVDADLNLKEVIPPEYWKTVVNIGDGSYAEGQQLKNARHIIEDVYGTAALDEFKKFIAENTAQLPEKMQARINSKITAIADIFEDFKHLDMASRTAIFLAIKQQGLVLTTNSFNSQATLNTALGRTHNTLLKIQTLDADLNYLYGKLEERITTSIGTESKYQGAERGQIWQSINQKQAQMANLSVELNGQARDIVSRIAPIDNEQTPFTLKSTVPSRKIDFSQITRYEQEFMGLKGLGQMTKDSILPAARSAWLPLVMTYFQAKGTTEAWGQVMKTKDIKDIAILAGSLAGTLASMQATLQAGYTVMIQNAVAKVQAQAGAALGAKAGGTKLAAKLGKFSILTGVTAQLLGAISSGINIYQNNSEWWDAVASGDPKLALSAMAVIIGNYGSAGMAVPAVGYSYRTATGMIGKLQNLRALHEAGKVVDLANATSKAWALRGQAFNMKLARIGGPAIFFTLIQFAGEYAYNHYKLDTSLKWIRNSCWGTEDQHWDEAQHYKKMSDDISEPTLVYLGERSEIIPTSAGPKYQAYRYLHLVLTGQSFTTLAEHPIKWEAGWYPDPDAPNAFQGGLLEATPDQDLTKQLKQTARIVNTDPLIIQFKLPFNQTDGYTKTGAVTGDLRPTKTMALRVWYTPDLASETLGKKNKLVFTIRLPIFEPAEIAPKTIKATQKAEQIYKHFKGANSVTFTLADSNGPI